MSDRSRRASRSVRSGWLLAVAVAAFTACRGTGDLVPTPRQTDLQFSKLSPTWDEGIPLGNATVGALVWQRGDALRFSLDRSDLWDLRPMDSLSGPNYRFDWVCEQAESGDYSLVQRKFDAPYEAQAGPSKLPGAALEFPGIEKLGRVADVRLYLQDALCEVRWDGGARLQTFVHATEPVGWFRFDGVPADFTPVLIPPAYGKHGAGGQANSIDGQGLGRLGYPQGKVESGPQALTYHQEGWGGFSYDVVVRWQRDGETLTGTWSIASTLPGQTYKASVAASQAGDALERGWKSDSRSHRDYWKTYWGESSVTLPDSILQRQYDNEMYKFGSAAREDSYPISLQSVWTADDGGLPPWKGDYHHDLNTQLSYWPAYAGNHLREAAGYVNTLWKQRPVYRRYTREYFGVEGLNVPGVCTLTGEPMGGWIQYAMSQTVSAWLAYHFYQQWRYSADPEFLALRAYPFARDVAHFLEQMSHVDNKGFRRLRLSSSPEFGDNAASAWFRDMTNFDLAQMHSAFRIAAEMADSLHLADEAAHWRALRAELPQLSTGADGALTIAPGVPYAASHRHFSHLVAIYPLGVLTPADGPETERTLRSSVARLDSMGPDYWTGYSYAWQGCLKARLGDGDGAERALRTFAECFCLPNTFHANGDQSGRGMSLFTYRPFTLEGNFAFAAGIQEMLLQSWGGTVRLFPAVPSTWPEASFRSLRAEGAFLVSANWKRGGALEASFEAERGGRLRVAVPKGMRLSSVRGGHYTEREGVLEFDTRPGQNVHLAFLPR